MYTLIASVLLIVSFVLPLNPAHADPIPVMGVVATSSHATNVPINTIDGNLATRWSAEGDGQTITYELELCDTVASVQIAWHQGNTRKSFFDIEVSDDGATWTPVYSGESSGTSVALETVEIEDVPACSVRIVGHGNSATAAKVKGWNSITEVVILGVDVAPETIAVPLAALEQMCAPLLAK